MAFPPGKQAPPFGGITAKASPFAALKKGAKPGKKGKPKFKARVAPPMVMPEPDMDQMGGPSDKDADDKP